MCISDGKHWWVYCFLSFELRTHNLCPRSVCFRIFFLITPILRILKIFYPSKFFFLLFCRSNRLARYIWPDFKAFIMFEKTHTAQWWIESTKKCFSTIWTLCISYTQLLERKCIYLLCYVWTIWLVSWCLSYN